MYAYCIGYVLADTGFGYFHHFVLQGIHFFAFAFALLVGQGGIGHGSIDVFHLAVQLVELDSDGLINVIVGSTGSGTTLFIKFDIDFPVFKEEVHYHTFRSGRIVSDVTVGGSVLRTLESESPVGDDCGIELYELAAFYGLQINGIAISCPFYCSGYGVTIVSAVTSCEYGSSSEQVS